MMGGYIHKLDGLYIIGFPLVTQNTQPKNFSKHILKFNRKFNRKNILNPYLKHIHKHTLNY